MRMLLVALMIVAATQAALHPVGVSILPVDPNGGVANASVYVWRPIRSHEPPMTLREFASLACGERLTLVQCLPDLTQPTGLAGGAILSATQLDALSGERLRAVKGGEPDQRRFPLVVLYGSPTSRGAELLSLAETLASHGFVVASIVPPVSTVRPAFSIEEARQAHARVHQAIASLTNTQGVDASRIALIAWSFGGVPLALESMANSKVQAFVSLDSAVRYRYGADLIRRSGQYQPAAFRGRVLSIVAGIDNPVEKDEGVLREMVNARLDRVVMAGLRHGDFSDLYFAMPYRVMSSSDALPLRRAHGEMMAQVVAWVQSALRND